MCCSCLLKTNREVDNNFACQMPRNLTAIVSPPASFPPCSIAYSQPVIMLKMTGSSASLKSIRMEIMQRIQREFMMSSLRVDFAL